ncbi:MAG: hypothetical protein SPH32_09185 [Erysipelotrichaceae bacterium]|nr:hypothetical protein [Erysipelotrichaceae bacterium]
MAIEYERIVDYDIPTLRLSSQIDYQLADKTTVTFSNKISRRRSKHAL